MALTSEYQEFIPHIVLLRKRLIRVIVILSLLFAILFAIDEHLYAFIAKPLLQILPQNGALIATEVLSPFLIPMKLAFVATLVLTIPYLLYELWSFVAPGLYKNEKRLIFPIILCSTGLFYIGILFAYYVICPLALHFFANAAPKGVLIMTDIRDYLEFVLTLLLSGGIAFQVPVVTYALIKSKCVTVTLLAHLRPYVIVAAFIVGMLLTPPDVVSQILLALPMWILFELGLWFGRYC